MKYRYIKDSDLYASYHGKEVIIQKDSIWDIDNINSGILLLTNKNGDKAFVSKTKVNKYFEKIDNNFIGVIYVNTFQKVINLLGVDFEEIFTVKPVSTKIVDEYKPYIFKFISQPKMLFSKHKDSEENWEFDNDELIGKLVRGTYIIVKE